MDGLRGVASVSWTLVYSADADTFEGDDLAGWVHDGTVSRDGSPDGVRRVGHVHDHHLVLITHFLPDADELVRLHGQVAEPDVGRVHPKVLQLEEAQPKTHQTLQPQAVLDQCIRGLPIRTGRLIQIIVHHDQ